MVGQRHLRPDVQRRDQPQLDDFRRIPHPHQLQKAQRNAGDGHCPHPHHDRGLRSQPDGRILQLRPADAAPAEFPLCRGAFARAAAHHRSAGQRRQFLAPRPVAGTRGLQCRQFEIYVPAGAGFGFAHPHQRTAGQQGRQRNALHPRLGDRGQRRAQMGGAAGTDARHECLSAAGRA